MNEYKERIVKSALRLMLDTNHVGIVRSLAHAASVAEENGEDEENRFVSMYSGAQPMYQRIIDIVDVISDNGLIYISTKEDLMDIWVELRSIDEQTPGNSLIDWLIQTTTTFIAMVFESRHEYDAWIEELSSAYASHIGSGDMHGLSVIDPAVAEKLPNTHADKDTSSYLDLINANPWYVYLLTLQMGLPYLIKELSGSGRNENR